MRWDVGSVCSARQATVSGFRLVNRENVFRVCDQPHPLLVKEIVGHCGKARLEDAYRGMSVRMSPCTSLLVCAPRPCALHPCSVISGSDSECRTTQR